MNWVSVVAAGCVFLPLAGAILTTSTPSTATKANLVVADLGMVLMGKYIWPVLSLGLLLTAALIGAVILVMEEKK